MSNISIWPMDRTLTSVTTPDKSRIGCNGNKEIARIPKSSRTGTSQWVTTHSSKLYHYWSLIIRLFSVINRSLFGWRVSLFNRDAVGVFYSRSRLGKLVLRTNLKLPAMEHLVIGLLIFSINRVRFLPSQSNFQYPEYFWGTNLPLKGNMMCFEF